MKKITPRPDPTPTQEAMSAALEQNWKDLGFGKLEIVGKLQLGLWSKEFGDEPLSDLGNARRLVKVHGNDIRYVHTKRAWHFWDGMIWREDDIGRVEQYAKMVTYSLYARALEVKPFEPKDFEKIARFAIESQRGPRIHYMLNLAQSETPIAARRDAFDRDPYLLTCRNGTLNLKTGHLGGHLRSDLITKLAPVVYDADATSPLWNAFLERVLPDAELRSFVQRLAGYSLTGDTREEVLPFVYGPTASGKSTFLEAFKSTLGDYARKARFAAFLRKRDDSGPQPEIARLEGSRFVIAVEADEGRRMAEVLVKELTGRDTIATRHLYQSEFEFRPTFTIWLGANDRPRVRDDDSAIWRRILQIPFDVEIPEAERDPEVKSVLTDPEKSGPAILAWAVQGCRDWLDDGLRIPQAVKEATNEYREAMNPLRPWLAECCDLDTQAWVASSDAWESYRKFDPKGIGRRAWQNRMKDEGFQADQHPTSRQRIWRGLRLTDATDAKQGLF